MTINMYPKISFNEQPNVFFGKVISYTCDMHIKLYILNPLNIMFLSNGLKMNPLPYNLFLQIFKTLSFLYDLVFHQVHPMNMYVRRRGHAFVVQKIWNQLYDFMSSFWFLKKKVFWTLGSFSLHDSKWHLYNIQLICFINLKIHHIIYWHTTIHCNYYNVR
jgi:hypothetical protein